jgi:hypothetical protein
MAIPFPDPGYDGEEPRRFVPLPGSEELGDVPSEHGLYVTLPAEELNLAGFAQNGQADTMAPGALLAVIVNTVTGDDAAGLKGCSDDQLAGIISAACRLESRAVWILMAAQAEFASRRPAQPGPLGGTPAEFAADELAAELHLTTYSAAAQIDFATSVAGNLAKTFAALSAGRIRPVHVRIIHEETDILTAEDRARADELLAAQAPGLTYGELRQAARKLVLKMDPDAVRKRKEAATRDTHVRRFRETSGNAGMIARELPSDEALASWQHIEQRALDLRAAGVPGTLEDLRIRAYLDLLQERDSRPAPDPTPPQASPADTANPGQDPPDGPPPGDPKGPPGPGNDPGGPVPHPAPRPGPGGPSLAALINVTIPLATWRGRSETPGEADDYGPLDSDDARAAAAAAARNPRTRWCLAALNDDGTAAAHACLPGRHPPTSLPDPGPPPGPPDPPPGPPRPGASPPSGPAPPGQPPGASVTMTPIARESCDHAHAETGYHPSRKLQHLIRVRNTTCTAPGCARPRPAATWTTPSPGTTAAPPANATSPRCAATTTAPSKLKAGISTRLSPASSPGTSPPGAPTPPTPPNTPSEQPFDGRCDTTSRVHRDYPRNRIDFRT